MSPDTERLLDEIRPGTSCTMHTTTVHCFTNSSGTAVVMWPLKSTKLHGPARPPRHFTLESIDTAYATYILSLAIILNVSVVLWILCKVLPASPLARQEMQRRDGASCEPMGRTVLGCFHQCAAPIPRYQAAWMLPGCGRWAGRAIPQSY
ncbi:hypothetical protein N656DRAFT_576834 [Canariomyces notabilis]|uniref:Uncharacterized protein n=1 Tax=Canariomyces notabilis TaxID=2074819 RepID=A0AAN6THZ5_9PEZI|nr:hypothetical protein N656DRAFT_576834 [Canariomyces arenarius]